MNSESMLAGDNLVISAVEIKRTYLETIEELKRFSQIDPESVENDAELDRAEEALLDFETYLLNQAAKLPLQTEDDVHALMDIWVRAIENEGDDGGERQSDNIAKTLIRHLGQLDR